MYYVSKTLAIFDRFDHFCPTSLKKHFIFTTYLGNSFFKFCRMHKAITFRCLLEVTHNVSNKDQEMLKYQL